MPSASEGLAPRDAIHQACLLRFRPILMTTMAAMLGALAAELGGRRLRAAPAAGHRDLRRPVVSQMLTLFTTPVIYLGFDRLGAA